MYSLRMAHILHVKLWKPICLKNFISFTNIWSYNMAKYMAIYVDMCPLWPSCLKKFLPMRSTGWGRAGLQTDVVRIDEKITRGASSLHFRQFIGRQIR